MIKTLFAAAGLAGYGLLCANRARTGSKESVGEMKTAIKVGIGMWAFGSIVKFVVSEVILHQVMTSAVFPFLLAPLWYIGAIIMLVGIVTFFGAPFIKGECDV